LTETVQQRIEYLAQRLPHGYQTPGQLADRYSKGYLTRFESEEEKAQVIRLASEMAAKKAGVIIDKKAIEVKPKDMSFDDIASRSSEKERLANVYVKGVYPDLPEIQKQNPKMPFLEQITTQMRNNGTYNEDKTDQFMNTIESLAGGLQQGGQARKSA
jgi:hypothetical protein